MAQFPGVAHFNFLDFPENFKKMFLFAPKRRNLGCSLAFEYLFLLGIYVLYFVIFHSIFKFISNLLYSRKNPALRKNRVKFSQKSSTNRIRK